MGRRRNTGVKGFITEDLKKQVDALMDNRRRLLAPFPIAAEQIYRWAWSPEERTAIRVLAKRARMLREGKKIYINGWGSDGRERTIHVNLKRELPMPGYTLDVQIASLPIEIAEPIREWAPRWHELKVEQNQLVNKVGTVAHVCKTYGQLYRLWPDILSLFNQEGREKVDYARVKSPYPPGVMGYKVDDETMPASAQRVLLPEYQPEAFAPFTDMIAECLMLPHGDEFEVGYVS